MRVVDHREELRTQVPNACPECGGAVHVEEIVSHSFQPETEWLGLDWWCTVDKEHWVDAPIAIG